MNCSSNNGTFPLPDSAIAEKNTAMFFERFPQLCRNLGFTGTDGQLLPPGQIQEHILTLLAARSAQISLDTAKSGELTLAVNGKFLHSKYNPEKEAERAAETVPPETACCVFPGLGLGYTAEAWIKKHPADTAVILEPDAAFLLLLLLYRDASVIFSHKNLWLLLETPLDVFSTMMNSMGTAPIYCMPQPAITPLNAAYYADAEAVIRRTNEKNAINEATRNKFGKLWLSNMSRNMRYMRQLPGITCFKDIAAADSARHRNGLPVLLIAAGPSLDAIRDDLPELAARCITVCVDTALRFCLAAGVQPDFVILVDPQYWNSRHLAGLSAPETFLITESAAYPPVFRFAAKQTFLCASLFPLGRRLENSCGGNGTLGAGGSVATTAWDFARYMGAPVIYAAGLDLSYPGKKTHFAGSLFEERIHTATNRLHPAETSSIAAQYGAERIPAKNYRGEDIATDRRLQLYAWWFESKIASLAAQHDGTPLATKTLGSGGLRIPGIQPAEPGEWRQLPDVSAEKNARLQNAAAAAADAPDKTAVFDTALAKLRQELRDIGSGAEKGLAAAQKAERFHRELSCAGLSGVRRATAADAFARCMENLHDADRAIMNSSAKELISMIFPGMSAIENNYEKSTDSVQDMLNKSCYIYRQLINSVNLHLSLVKN